MLWASISKGLREPCSPFREAYFYGAPLNSVNADGWNCLPAYVQPVSILDVSLIPKNTEAIVALVWATDSPGGTYLFKFQWARREPFKVIFEYQLSVAAPPGGWAYGYSYIGKVPWEISQNGQYQVDIQVTGVESYHGVATFTVTGFPVVEPGPQPGPEAVNYIVTILNSISSTLYQLYLEVIGWIWPFSLAAGFFWALSDYFVNLSWQFYEFHQWVTGVTSAISSIVSLDVIIDTLRTWLDWAAAAWGWVKNAPSNILQVIGVWWTGAFAQVQALIDAATQGLAALKAAWDNFWNVILPQLVTWGWLGSWWNSRLLEVQALIDSSLEEWLPWYDELGPLIAGIKEFLTDPLGWLWARFVDWFLGPEE